MAYSLVDKGETPLLLSDDDIEDMEKGFGGGPPAVIVKPAIDHYYRSDHSVSVPVNKPGHPLCVPLLFMLYLFRRPLIDVSVACSVGRNACGSHFDNKAPGLQNPPHDSYPRKIRGKHLLNLIRKALRGRVKIIASWILIICAFSRKIQESL